MPLIHTRVFRVRHCECGADGYVLPAGYLRYMQETAFDASAAAGYDIPRYAAMQRNWLIRETEIEFLHPLRYGDTFEVKTWVADFRRVRSRRAYDFRTIDTPRQVARAQTDWAFIDTALMRPSAIPPELIGSFFPEGAPEQAPPRTRFPAEPAPPPGAFRQTRAVQWSDLDQIGHVNNASYLEYIIDLDSQLASAHDWPTGRSRSAEYAIVPGGYRIDYREPALFGDDLALKAWHSAVGGDSLVRHYTISRVATGALLARVRAELNCIEPEGGQSRPLPSSFLESAAPLTAMDPNLPMPAPEKTRRDES